MEDDTASRPPASTRAGDAVLPLVLLLVGAMELATFRTPGWQASVLVEAATALLLVWRRRHVLFPLAALVPCFFIPQLGPQMNDVAAPILFFMLSLFTIARWYPQRVAVSGGVVALAFLIFAIAEAEDRFDPTDVVFVHCLAVPPFVFGRVVRRMAEQSRRIEAQQQELARQAVLAERGRIARELHDVIAHSVSAMVVQSAAAQDLVRSEPARAEELVANVADTGRQALVETGRLLHVIRDDADELGLAPTPGVADLPELVASFRAKGLLIEAQIAVRRRDLSAGVDVSAYRVVQESLTNALRHGDATRSPVRLSVLEGPDALEIRCVSPLRCRDAGDAPSLAGPGLGLSGMAERVAVLRGTLRHGRVGDSFEVAAHLPLASASAPQPVTVPTGQRA